MFQSGIMVLVRPEKWDDPFENYIVGAKFKIGNGTLNLGLRQTLHGSCWTRKSVSDALWRIYSPDKVSVRLKSTPSLLGKSLDKALARNRYSEWFVGKVNYMPQSKIVRTAVTLAKQILRDHSGMAAAKSLLFKRNAFSHEEEIRVLVLDGHSKSKAGMLRIPIDPHEVIQSVLIDSRAPAEIVSVYTSFLKSQLGFKGRISKSTLYDPLDPLVVEIPEN